MAIRPEVRFARTCRTAYAASRDNTGLRLQAYAGMPGFSFRTELMSRSHAQNGHGAWCSGPAIQGRFSNRLAGFGQCSERGRSEASHPAGLSEVYTKRTMRRAERLASGRGQAAFGRNDMCGIRSTPAHFCEHPVDIATRNPVADRRAALPDAPLVLRRVLRPSHSPMIADQLRTRVCPITSSAS